MGHHALIEQVVPGWDTEEGQAQLDVVYHDGAQGRVCLDVSLVDVVSVARHGRSRKPTLRRREREKHRRYPHAGLVPFVLDSRGRRGAEAETWLRQVLGAMPEEERGEARRQVRVAVALALQGKIAEQVALAVEYS